MDSAKKNHGALRQNGKYFKFNDPQGSQSYGSGINDHREIVGSYFGGTAFTGFRATY